MNADGSGQRNLTRSSTWDDLPVWLPDGRRIAFGSQRDGNGEVYVMNADGSRQQNLTRNPANDGEAAWSPAPTRSGKPLAYRGPPPFPQGEADRRRGRPPSSD